VARLFVIEAKSSAAVADLAYSIGQCDPCHRSRTRGRPGAGRDISGFQRIARQQVLQVGDDQLLVLLLVMHPELGQVARRWRHRGSKQLRHVAIHMSAIRHHFGEGRP
jgi:hypothetical protein